MRGSRRVLWMAMTAAASALALAAALVVWALDPASLKPRLVAEVQRASGRTLTISGGIGIKLSLVPTITIEDVTLSNPSGFSRPDMVKVARVELSVGLVPLLQHRIEVDHIALVRPDVLLESDQAGHRNWLFIREAPRDAGEPRPGDTPKPSGGQSGDSSAGGTPRERFTTSLKDISVEDGRVGWIDDASGRRFVAEVPRLTVVAPAGEPAQATGTVTYEGRTIALTARTGSLDKLDTPGTGGWPVALKLESGGTTITMDGQIAHPLQGREYSFTVDGNLPDPPALASLLPRLPLRTLRALTAHAEVSDSGGPIPTISALEVKVGSADLNTFVHGSRLEDVTLSGRGNAPLKVSARVTMGGFESGLSGTAGDLAWLTSGRSGPVAVDLAWNAASARATVKGMIQAPRQFAGFALDVTLDVPDPALVMEGAPLALKSVAFQARLTDAPGPVPFQLTSNAGDLAGELSISRDPRFSVSGRVSSRHLDLDMLRVPPAAAVQGDAPTETAAAQPPAADKTAPLIPDTKLPFDLIRAADADLKFALDHVRLGGSDIVGINAGLSMKVGVLRLDPFTATAPDQRFSARLVVDAVEAPPSVHLTLDAPGLALRPVLAAFGLPPAATGTVEARADLIGTGDSPRAIAATLDGRAGLAIEGGQLDARLVNTWLERLKPLRIEGADVTDLRCFAIRADAKSGVVTVEPFALNTAALIVEGGGEVDLGHETLALHVRPRAKMGRTGIALPLRVSGPMREPSAKVDISAAGVGGKGLAGLLLGGKDVMGAAGGGDPCPAALSRAREGASPSLAAPGLALPASGGKK